ncbi:hypothetical protein [Kiloniella laminariae]|uniref:hypothetical protein n=1 Tax=Kiloniella laminariae TaxID=454162 RepID=UPI0003AA748F|nr:hypothetical protein [Kiloniella laminariae]
MPRYDFYIAYLRFLAKRTERINDEVAEMMDILGSVADQIEAGQAETGQAETGPAEGKPVAFVLSAVQLRLGARALAGVAGFLQKQILPEVVANQNSAGERDVRWVIDTSMALTSKILMHAEITKDAEELAVTLPQPPTVH